MKKYEFDGLLSVHNHDFMEDRQFLKAYDRGIKAADGVDYGWYWRVHTGLWAAKTASSLTGDFVECGTNKGFLASAIMKYLDWNKKDKLFYLLDTFNGIDLEQVSIEELNEGIKEKDQKFKETGFYTTSVNSVRKNFDEWNNVRIIEGSIPSTLENVKSRNIAFLHIDLNNATPEVQALEYFWHRIYIGGIILLDDYGYITYHHQKNAMDKLSEKIGFSILSLPTGQGLIVKNKQ